jgi:hypothetical protein
LDNRSRAFVRVLASLKVRARAMFSVRFRLRARVYSIYTHIEYAWVRFMVRVMVWARARIRVNVRVMDFLGD